MQRCASNCYPKWIKYSTHSIRKQFWMGFPS